MRNLVEQIGSRLQAFIDQRDNLALIVRSPDTDALPILTTLDGLEATNASDLFWKFTDGFTDAAAYASAVVAGFATTHGAMQLAMQKADIAAWPPIPAHILAEHTPPARRLRDLAAFSRELLPVPGGGNNVWIYYPLQVGDWWAFAALMKDVLHHDVPVPWCHHLRFLIRDDPAAPALQAVLGGAPRVDWYEPDLSAESIRRSLEEQAADDSLPLEERLANVMVMAGADSAMGRHPQALEKYELLLRYFAPMGNHAMAAVSLNGMGEAYEKMGDVERANTSYHAALIPASHGDNPPIPVFLNVVLNLANLRFTQQRWDEGEAYYDSAQQLATLARNGSTKVRALEYRGVCQQRQGKLDDAERSWIDGSVIAAQLEDVDLCRSQVERLRQHYAQTGRVAEEWERREQLAALSATRSA